jgi:hypothetical protein
MGTGVLIDDTGTESSNGPQERSTKGSSKTIDAMDKGRSATQTGPATKGNGATTKKMEKAPSLGLVAQPTLAVSGMTKCMARALSRGRARPSMRATGVTTRKMAMEPCFTKMALLIKAIGKMTSVMCAARCNGQMVHRMKVTLRKTFATVKVHIPGQTNACMRAAGIMVNAQVTVKLATLMVVHTRVCSRTTSKMVSVSSNLPMEAPILANGKMI